jgi:2-dehydropantoate 2-reductase
MRIAIFGTGGAGGYFGAQLALAGEDVVFIARGDHLRAIKANVLRRRQAKLSFGRRHPAIRLK